VTASGRRRSQTACIERCIARPTENPGPAMPFGNSFGSATSRPAASRRRGGRGGHERVRLSRDHGVGTSDFAVDRSQRSALGGLPCFNRHTACMGQTARGCGCVVRPPSIRSARSRCGWVRKNQRRAAVLEAATRKVARPRRAAAGAAYHSRSRCAGVEGLALEVGRPRCVHLAFGSGGGRPCFGVRHG
jgi:hypothetical protein